MTSSALRTGKLSTEEVCDLPKAHSWWVLEAGFPPGQFGPRGQAPGHHISRPSVSPSSWGRAGTWARTPVSVLFCAPARVPGSSLQKGEFGSQDLGLSGRQWAGRRQIPRTEGLCLPADWAGRPGLCSPAQRPVGCKLISRPWRLPRSREQLQGRAPAGKGEPHRESR